VGTGMAHVQPVLFSAHHTLPLLSGDYYSKGGELLGLLSVPVVSVYPQWLITTPLHM